MKYKHSLLFVSLVISLYFISCKTSERAIRNNDGGNDVVKQLVSQHFNFEWFSAKAKLDFEDKSGSTSSTANFRCQKDKVIWISFSLFGIEGGRALITPDTLKILDRINKQYRIEPFSFIKNFVPYDIDFTTLQDLVAGNVIFFNKENAVSKKTEEGYIINSTKDPFNNETVLDLETMLIKSMKVRDTEMNRDFNISFADYRLVDEQPFSFMRTIELKAGENVNISLEFDKVVLNDSLSFPFSVSEKYERIH